MTKDDIEGVWRDHHKTVYRAARMIVQNDADADDITQNVFLKLCRLPSIHLDESRGSISSFFITIGRNAAIDFLRKERRHDCQILETPIEDLAFRLPSDQHSADFILELRELFGKAMGGIRKRNRAAVILMLNGYQYDEIADRLEISIGTVKSRVFRGRQEALAAI